MITYSHHVQKKTAADKGLLRDNALYNSYICLQFHFLLITHATSGVLLLNKYTVPGILALVLLCSIHALGNINNFNYFQIKACVSKIGKFL